MAPPSSPSVAPAREHLFEMIAQIAIFAAQIEEALAGADSEGRERHALEHMIGEAGQQHAILERSGFAFVGVANDDAPAAVRRRRLFAKLPFLRGRKAGAAAPAQIGRLHLRQQRVGADRDRAAQRFARRELVAQQNVATANIVVDGEKFPRPGLERNLFADQLSDGVDALFIEPGDRHAVHQGGRPLVAHADAGGRVHADQPVLGDFSGLDPQSFAKAPHQRRGALHLFDDIVREQHAITPDGARIKETVKADDALDARARQAERRGDARDGARRQPVETLLRR